MKAIKGGTYTVSEEMIEDMRNEINGEHASNLGALLAKTIADEIGVQSFVVDPVSVDEFEDVCICFMITLRTESGPILAPFWNPKSDQIGPKKVPPSIKKSYRKTC